MNVTVSDPLADGSTVQVTVTGEGVIIDIFDPAGEPYGTEAASFDEIYERVTGINQPAVPPTCVLVDAAGEDPDDCATHDHEPRPWSVVVAGTVDVGSETEAEASMLALCPWTGPVSGRAVLLRGTVHDDGGRLARHLNESAPTARPGRCQRCGTSLGAGGLCGDQTCPYSRRSGDV